MSIVSLNKDVVLDYNSLTIQSDLTVSNNTNIAGALAVNGNTGIGGNLVVGGTINGITGFSAGVLTAALQLQFGVAAIPATCDFHYHRIGPNLVMAGYFQITSITSTTGSIKITPPWSFVAAENSFGVVSLRQASGTVVSSNFEVVTTTGQSYLNIFWSIVGSATLSDIGFQITTFTT